MLTMLRKDHCFVASTFETKEEWDTSDIFRDPILREEEMNL